MNKIFLIAIISLFAVLGCSSSEEFVKNEIEIELSDIVINSQSKNLSVKSPQNWSSVEDNFETIFDIWLVSPNNKAVISFTPLSINNNSRIDSDEEAIKLLSKISLERKKSSNSDFKSETEIQYEETDKFLFSQLYYEIEDKQFKSVIFGKNNTYYECLAYFSKSYTPTEDEYEALFKLQTLIISTANFK